MQSLKNLFQLVGPEMDTDSPKESGALFNDVKDFFLDQTRSKHLSEYVFFYLALFFVCVLILTLSNEP